MSEWRRFTAIQMAKRKAKKTGEESTMTEEIVVQRMTADISGKQQKYTRIGPQEYVPFEHEEIRTSKTPAKSTSGPKSKNITLVQRRIMQVSHDATRMNYIIKSSWSHDPSLTRSCLRRTLRRSPIPPYCTSTVLILSVNLTLGRRIWHVVGS